MPQAWYSRESVTLWFDAVRPFVVPSWLPWYHLLVPLPRSETRPVIPPWV